MLASVRFGLLRDNGRFVRPLSRTLSSVTLECNRSLVVTIDSPVDPIKPGVLLAQWECESWNASPR